MNWSMTSNLRGPLWALLGLLVASSAHAQTFDSQSDGSDGPLDYTGQTGTIDFDPDALGLDADDDNIFHFTRVTIPAGVTLRLPAANLNMAPVYFLSSGDVIVQGEIDLSGAQGHSSGLQGAQVDARNSIPGPGGFHGGVGGVNGGASQPGFGPSAGGGNGGNGANSANAYLIPLVGGSGAAGGQAYTTCIHGAGGGAGGGALLIASSTLIRVDGTIRAEGGLGGPEPCNSYNGGRGGGGSVRLLAPTVAGAGTISAAPNGAVRTEAFSGPFGGTMTGGNGKTRSVTLSQNANFLPTTSGAAGRLRFVRIAGVNAPATPTGSFLTPDVVIDAPSAVLIEIAAQDIPVGTVVHLKIQNETDAGLQVDTSPLAGTDASSTASALVTLSPGFSKLFISASW